MRTLKNFQTGILSCKSLEDHILYFEKGVRLKVSLITVNAPAQINTLERNGLYKKLRKTFLTKDASEHFRGRLQHRL